LPAENPEGTRTEYGCLTYAASLEVADEVLSVLPECDAAAVSDE